MVGLLVIVRRYASSLGGVAGPYTPLSLGPLAVLRRNVSLSLARTRRRWWVYSPSLGRGQGLLIVVGMSPGPTRFHWVSSLLVSYSSSLGPFPHSGITRVTMVGVGWSCLLRYAGVGRNVGVGSMLSEARKKEKNDENEPQLWSWFALVTY